VILQLIRSLGVSRIHSDANLTSQPALIPNQRQPLGVEASCCDQLRLCQREFPGGFEGVVFFPPFGEIEPFHRKDAPLLERDPLLF
jgi:hypothetical protein